MTEPATDLAERYVRLALRLDRVDEGVVEAYYGPADLKAAVDVGSRPAAGDLVAEAEELHADLADGWLRDQVRALRTRAGMLAGETWTYTAEVESCFGVSPTHTTQEQLEAAYADLQGLLPGPGPLAERYRAWEHASQVPAEHVPALVDAVAELSRGQARRLFGLPDGEGFEIEYVSGEAWMAFHEYAGHLRATVSVNVDLQRSGLELLHTVLHETYAGHHAEACLKEVGLVRERGRVEQTVVVVPTPQSVLSEGLAEVGPGLLLDDDEPSYAGLLREAGVDTDLARDRAVLAAVEPVQRLGADAGRLLHEEGWTEADVVDFLLRWALVDRDMVEHVVRFVSDPMSRGYVNCYPQGRARCQAFVNGDVGRFRTLLTEQMRVSDLLPASL
jgi:hypothetical protein